jgi:hypothetical protein
VEAPKLESTPITDDFLNDLKEMSNEPIKKVVIENESQDTQEVLIKNEEGIFEEVSIPLSVPANEPIKASDDDVISMLDNVSANVINDVISLIDERTKSFLNNAEAFQNLDFSEHRELIYSEVKKRVGILLNK